ncbi:MAG: thioredoxin [Gemmataceae bacterium]|nr:thioredoxin [Gemmataceae bacterium]MDW8264800.1 thioredoxin [Gemmataceae bacterium]
MAHVFTDDNFETEVLQAKEPVLVDFWAPWCGPCRQMTPIIDRLAQEMTGVKIGKVNVDDCPGLATEYGISSIPALLVFKGGKVVSRMVGVQSAALLKEKLEAAKA